MSPKHETSQEEISVTHERPAMEPWQRELIVQRKIGNLLASLDLAGRERVTAWLFSQFGPKAPGSPFTSP